jgi:hypothetical protein
MQADTDHIFFTSESLTSPRYGKIILTGDTELVYNVATSILKQ